MEWVKTILGLIAVGIGGTLGTLFLSKIKGGSTQTQRASTAQKSVRTLQKTAKKIDNTVQKEVATDVETVVAEAVLDILDGLVASYRDRKGGN